MLTKAAQHDMPGTREERTPAMRNWWIAAALFLLTLLLYLPTVRNGFVDFDDGEYITANPHVLAGLTAADLNSRNASISILLPPTLNAASGEC